MNASYLHAEPGDRIIVHGRNLGDSDRDGEVIETSPGGVPPFTVRWSDNGHMTMYFPAAGVEIHHHGSALTS